ncbi:DUF2182 domain-containing protein [Williamsia sp. 1135]|uniref:DUF2182 domain-containing protein n=1 Tax=Williamsia sp. 1135 TaxID=1889262 RepID=UPI000A101EC9|nr:DUF2182 domain-containing protein [Williamsia sp. 1135]ORM32797.1 hypothetical protein BFL43_14895 [Williamsia sp. 1135]
MSTGTVAAPAILRSRPEWTVLAAVVAAWIVWCTLAMRSGGHADHAQVQSYSMAAALDSGAMWLVMVMAMMLPATVPAIRYVAYATRRQRRQRSILLFAAGFVAVWVVLGVPVLGVAEIIGGPVWIGVLALSAAALYELTPLKRKALRRCHRTLPIRFDGRPADQSCLRFGIHQGYWCVHTCGPAMVAVVLLGHPLLVTALVGAILFAERVLVRPDRLRLFVGYVGLAYPTAVLLVVG